MAELIEDSSKGFLDVDFNFVSGIRGKIIELKFTKDPNAAKLSVKDILILACYGAGGTTVTEEPTTITEGSGLVTTVTEISTSTAGFLVICSYFISISQHYSFACVSVFF